jgi:hypothetical protein
MVTFFVCSALVPSYPMPATLSKPICMMVENVTVDLLLTKLA